MLRNNAVALVTGAATGIGRATAEAFARAGARVVIADRDAERGAVTARELHEIGPEVLFVPTDMADAKAVADLIGAVERRFGRLDYACNNAGIEGEQGPTADCTLENFDRVIAVNLRGVFLCMKYEIPLLLKGGGGAIVNMASVAGLVGFAGLPAYCASKGGVVQLTKTAALEYATQGIRVNAICPGAIQTEMIDRIINDDPGAQASFRAMHPMNRMGQPEEIADAVVWLCSEQASFVTGHTLPVDGGMVAR